MDSRILTCPSCGKKIPVPTDLESFSCVYCGAKHRASQLLEPVPTADESDRIYAEAHLLDCIRNYPNYYRNFSRKSYEASFCAYRDGIAEAFHALDRYICAQPQRRQQLLEGFAAQFLRDWESFHRLDKRWQHKSSREKMLFDDKLTLAWYTVPAIRDLGLATGNEFTELLQQRFVDKYPENVFQCGTYEEISQGFRKHKLCFITTAVCEFEGKPDDCAELTAFRTFRDGWLSATEQGRTLIREYYDIAPAVVTAIDYCDDRAARYIQLRRDWLAPCYEALQAGDNETCKRVYVDMVHTLQKTYRITPRVNA